jgi:protein-disulfide isomerase
MKGETKLFIGIIAVTVAIIAVAALFLNQKPSGTSSDQTKVAASILVREDSNKISTKSATITLVEFGDFQCPACGSYFPVVKQITNEFHDQMNFVFRNFPLSQHQYAIPAAKAAEAAGKQGKYWEMFDVLYEKQTEWSASPNAQTLFSQYAQSLGLNVDQWKKDLADGAIQTKIDADQQDGNSVGVNATPTFYLDGIKLENPATVDDFRTLVKAALLKVPVSQAPSQAVHIHFNLKVYIDGKPVDFTLAKYQSANGKDLNEDIHLHDGNGDVVHIHKKGVTLKEFFTSLKMELTKTCLTDDLKNKNCTDAAKKLQMFVNGQPNNQFESYEPKDLDRILITYGSETDAVIKQQEAAVSDNACIYSEKCPERGKPPTENCVGGLGTGCTE